LWRNASYGDEERAQEKKEAGDGSLGSRSEDKAPIEGGREP
jgi:hypothetical protein